MSFSFLDIPKANWIASNTLVFAFRDNFPVSPGHTLLVPKRIVKTWFEITLEEKIALFELLDVVKKQLESSYFPDGYNIGFNSGTSAGQTIDHLHIHIIPRYKDDVDDPRGGVRFVIPSRGNYKNPGKLPIPKSDNVIWKKRNSLFDLNQIHLVTNQKNNSLLKQLKYYLPTAKSLYIVTAFIQNSGIDELESFIKEALKRGVCFQIITGDYLHITQSYALRRLLDWSQIYQTNKHSKNGSFEVRIIEVSRINNRSFHPKSWRIEGKLGGIAWIGSSNWSKSALTTGIEWNLRIHSNTDLNAYKQIAIAFESLWKFAQPLSETWLLNYEKTDFKKELTIKKPIIETTQIKKFKPRGFQPLALKMLKNARENNQKRALIILATGLGKTFLAAFDVRQFAKKTNHMPKTLFIAHRYEILIQASETFRAIFPNTSIGFYVGNEKTISNKKLVFASIQKLNRNIDSLKLELKSFEYIIIDESHHVTSNQYRKILTYVNADFLLGLTATPERTDHANIAELFDDFIAYKADLNDGISQGYLAPFHYIGLKDTTSYLPIPWRRFTVSQLNNLIETEKRMQKLWNAWQTYSGSRTLIFCASIHHCDYVSNWLSKKNIRVVSIHSGENSGDRNKSLVQFKNGDLDAICSIDMFNEGIDIPSIDRIIMLRPTKSSIVFLQQLGRGLRLTKNKKRLQVIDFIGNHKVFLYRIKSLLSLEKHNYKTVQSYLETSQELILPKGCEINIELEAINMLRELFPKNRKKSVTNVESIYYQLCFEQERPTAGELIRKGFNLTNLRKKYNGWFNFVSQNGNLSIIENMVLEEMNHWFLHIEKTNLTKSFKMVILDVLLQNNVFFSGINWHILAKKCYQYLLRQPVLFQDLLEVKILKNPYDLNSKIWEQYWKKNPIKAWLNGNWFELRNDNFLFITDVVLSIKMQSIMKRMTRELVDMRLGQYRRRISKFTELEVFA